MDITLVSHLGSAAQSADTGRTSMARGPQAVAKAPVTDVGRVMVEKAAAVAAVEIAEAVQALDKAELPVPMTVRSELNVDDGSRRVFARTVDRQTGETVRQVPDEETLRLIRRSREQFGKLLNKSV